ncbi:MAG TPA: pyridoxal-phosphate dependent enzyme [Steroidobacteraceae bacterium]|jgi:threonine dehydratase|nr:pyridoxal-phosphate dependent enzyme [Steroidobacteraceae bacterium]
MPKPTVRAVSIADIRAAQARLGAVALHSPLVPCFARDARCEIHLKLDNLQPTGSFKVRPVGNAVLARPAQSLQGGIYTVSSGNSALAVAYLARRLGVAAAAVVSAGTPRAKLEGLRALGARIVELPFDAWWRAIESCGVASESGTYIDAARDPAAIAGDGSLGIEILEQLPQVEAIFTPLGGGALACGIACAVRALNPAVKVIACELESAQPFGAALRAGKVVTTEARAGFVSGVGFHSLLPEMWPLAQEVIAGAMTVSLAEVAAAIGLLAERNKVIAEGAGAIPVAAALSGRHAFRRVCAVVSGGNLDVTKLCMILAGKVPD